MAGLWAEMVGRALGKMADGMTAADTLRALLTAEGESVRLGAAPVATCHRRPVAVFRLECTHCGDNLKIRRSVEPAMESPQGGYFCSVLEDGTLVQHAEANLPFLLCPGSRSPASSENRDPAPKLAGSAQAGGRGPVPPV